MSLHKRIAAHRARAYLRMVGHALRYRADLALERLTKDQMRAEIAAATARAEKAEAASGKSWYFEMVKAEERAERAEALLRDASKEGYLYHAGYCQYVDLKPRPCNCGFEAWQKRVLEGKT